MTKYKSLGLANILLSIFFVFLLATSAYSQAPLASIESFIHAYAPNGVLLFSFFLNTYLAYQLLLKKQTKFPFFVYLILTFSTAFWFLLLFVAYFFASSVLFPIVAVTLVIGTFYFIQKISKKLAIAISLITLLVCGVVISSSFEEDYCWGKGTAADSTGSQMVTATKADAAALKDFDVKEGDKIGVSFRAHMLCHTTFKLMDAVKEKWL